MPVRIVVHDQAITDLVEFGPVRDFTQEVARKIRDNAIEKAARFSRTGALAASHHYRTRARVRSVVGTVYNDSDHAIFVHEGTRSPIVPNPRPTRTGRPPSLRFVSRGELWFKREVSGQRANPWLRRAMVDVLAEEGVL